MNRHGNRKLNPFVPLVVAVLMCGVLVPAGGEQSIVFEIPRLREAPVIDGTIDPAEWGGAAALSGVVSKQADRYPIAERQFTAWLGWDEDALYLAVRALQQPGQAFTFGEGGSYDNIEFAVLPFQADDLRHVYRLFVLEDRAVGSDIAGVRQRQERPPVIIRARRADGWADAAEVASQVVPDPAHTLGEGTMIWEVEVRFPRDIFAIDEPNAANHGWRMLLSRTYSGGVNAHMPLSHRDRSGSVQGWTGGGGGIGYFFDPRGYMQARLVEDAPVVQLLDMLPLLRGTGGAELVLVNPGATDTELTVELTVRRVGDGQILHEASETVAVPAGARVPHAAGADAGRMPAGRLDLKVSSSGGCVLLAYHAELEYPKASD